MAFGGRPFWRQPGNRRDSNKCRSSAPVIGVDKLEIIQNVDRRYPNFLISGSRLDFMRVDGRIQ
jgi:hypothetical protein